jgi:hypothetical protein
MPKKATSTANKGAGGKEKKSTSNEEGAKVSGIHIDCY